MGGNEFGNKPPEVRPPVAPSKDRQAEMADWRTKFGFDKLKATEARAPQETVVDRRTPKEHVLKHELPSAPGREAYERSPDRKSVV